MPKDSQEQIAELQAQTAFQEDSIQKLSDALYSQQQRMDEMEQQIERLKNELEKAQSSGQIGQAGDELPPHY